MKKLVWLLWLCPAVAYSQKISNVAAAVAEGKIIITYDLSGQADDTFTVSLYQSYDSFVKPLTRVTGDVGRGVVPGPGKRIEWVGIEELPGYLGNLSFEVRAIVVSPLKFTNKVASGKRGKVLPVYWKGGSKTEEVKVELVNGGVSQGYIGTVGNTGQFNWQIPDKQKTGTKYQVRLANGNEVITSENFSVNHKVATILKILPIAAVGVLVVVLLKGNSSGSKDLPAPPDLGLN